MVAITGGSVIVTESLRDVDTFPAASLAQAYNVLEPSVENVYVVGAEDVQPLSPANGAVEVSVSL